MAKFTFWTADEEAEIKSLINEGYDILDVVELFSNTLKRTEASIKSKIYNIMETIPGAKEAMARKRKTIRAAKKVITSPVEPAKKPTVQEVVYTGVVKNETDSARELRLSKTQVVSVEKTVQELKYPLFAKYIKTKSNHIVMFTSLHRCVVLVPGESGLAAGHVSETLGSCRDTEHWDILDAVTIRFSSF